jgi:hypothetical protein
LADIEWVQMADRIKVFPIVILAVVLLLGLVLFWVSRRPRESARDVQANPPPPPQRPAPAPAQAPAEAPPQPVNPGEKILEGADGAFKAGMFETALKFYKDFELRYAGSEVHDRNLTRLWERIHTSGASMPKKDETLPAYLEARRKLAEEWKRIKPLLAAPPTEESRAEARRYADALPPGDGRLKLIEAWREEKK